ncbi:hypothetical protein D1007_11980 [Hordeum vulgare]|nr:hypothetical protein D1007_11980 [Hordeum vulgare]
MAADWSQLPPDLLRRLGDDLLADGDIDYYMGMRAVCHGWLSALVKPRPLGVGADHRFRPRNWIMLHEKFHEAADGRRLFVNVSTGRFLRRRVPMLDDHQVLQASNGLLVLRGKASPPAICVLEPFTGSVLRAPDVLKDEDEHDGDDDGNVPYTFYFVPDPATGLRAVQFPQYSEGREYYYVNSMLAHAGHVYVADTGGCVFRIVEWERPSFGYGELIAKMDFHANLYRLYLVESDGEMLLVSLASSFAAAKVYRVDVDRSVLEPLDSIGSRALFLGHNRSLSVDANKFPSMDRNCVYIEDIYLGHDLGHEVFVAYHVVIYMYDLSTDGLKEHVFDDLISPLSLAKVFLDYCNHLTD